jgi:hydrogenase nickel incorporation protein HypA/HybF
MHELALCDGIIDLVLDAARQERIARVTRVVVEIGTAASVDPDALLFCFPAAALGTLAADAELVIQPVALQACCDTCRTHYTPETLHAPCPGCGGFGGRVTAGREMRVVSFHGA